MATSSLKPFKDIAKDLITKGIATGNFDELKAYSTEEGKKTEVKYTVITNTVSSGMTVYYGTEHLVERVAALFATTKEYKVTNCIDMMNQVHVICEGGSAETDTSGLVFNTVMSVATLIFNLDRHGNILSTSLEAVITKDRVDFSDFSA
ncbi:MAG: hypothetical protein S4CHLAM37_01160 [Chlamydiia bacterium]|nr:hypothetical protein [Chlamydiia bacterium]